MADLWFLLTLAAFCGCYACIPAQAAPNSTAQLQAQNCPPFYSSCREAYLAEKCAGKTPTSGEYDIAFLSNGNRVVKTVYCDMQSTLCGPKKGWMQVAELDMTVAGSKCPSGLDEGMYGSKKLCGNRASGCKSTTINTFGVPYTEVCGYVAGFQYKTPNAFHGKSARIDSTYLDGISITHGTPRKHIWSFAAGDSSDLARHLECPCNVGGVDNVPTFVNDNWYCESGNPTNKILYQFFPNDVLWDGKQCTGKEPPCCKSPFLPYFHTDVEGVATDSIEMRICHDESFSNEDVPIESYQFLVR